MKPVVVGHAPAEQVPPGAPVFLHADVGRRLARLCGLDGPERLTRHFTLVNMLDRRGIPLAQVSASERRTMALRILAWARRTFDDELPPLIACGGLVAAAFGVRGRPYRWHRLEAQYGDGAALATVLAIIHHPSGRNRWYNSERNRRRAAAFLRGVIARQAIEGAETNGEATIAGA